MEIKTFKIRFVKENNRHTLQIRNIFGIWITQKEKVCSDAGCFKQAYNHKDKIVLLRYVLLKEHWSSRDASIIEYPTLKKYKLIVA